MTIMPQPDVWSVGIQCDLLAAPPLNKLQYKEDDIIEESLPSKAERADLDTSFYIWMTPQQSKCKPSPNLAVSELE